MNNSDVKYTVGILLRNNMRTILFKLGLRERTDYIENRTLLQSQFIVNCDTKTHLIIQKVFNEWNREVERQRNRTVITIKCRKSHRDKIIESAELHTGKHNIEELERKRIRITFETQKAYQNFTETNLKNKVDFKKAY